MKLVTRVLLVLSVSIVATLPGQAQTFGGQAVDRASGKPMVALEVRLLKHHDGVAVPGIVDSTKTDERGLFEFRVVSGGVYQAEFGPWSAPYSLGPIDTVGSSMIRRRYVVPVPQPAATARVLGDSMQGRSFPMHVRRSQPRPSVLDLGARTALGALVGGSAGFIVAELRCGRIRGCEAATSFPYYPGGAAIGAAIGSATSAMAASCRLGFLRGLVGSVLGSLAGSVLGGDGLQGKHAAGAVGAAVGGVALVATCRMAE